MNRSYGLCAADTLCRAYDPVAKHAEDAQHQLGAACLRAGEFAVRALPGDWLDLEQLLPRPLGQWGDGLPHGGDGPPVPLSLGVEALQRAVWWTVTAWEEVAREFDGLSDVPGRVREGPAVVRACRVLAPRVEALCDHPGSVFQDYPAGDGEARRLGAISWSSRSGWQGVLDLITLHQRCKAMLGLTAPVRRLPGVCTGCGRGDLRQDQPRFRGDERLVYCANCAQQVTYDDWRRAMGGWAA